jgi:hypothetical protein
VDLIRIQASLERRHAIFSVADRFSQLWPACFVCVKKAPAMTLNLSSARPF